MRRVVCLCLLSIAVFFSCSDSPELDLKQEVYPLDSLAVLLHIPDGLLRYTEQFEAISQQGPVTAVLERLKKDTASKKYLFSYRRAENLRFGLFFQQKDSFYYLLEQADSLWDNRVPLQVSHTLEGDFLVDPSAINSKFEPSQIRGNVQLDSSRLSVKANLTPISTFLKQYISFTSYQSEKPHVTVGLKAGLIKEINTNAKIKLPEDDVVLYYEYLGEMLDSSVVVSSAFDEEFNRIETRKVSVDTMRLEQALLHFDSAQTAAKWLTFLQDQGFVTAKKQELTIMPDYRARLEGQKLYIQPIGKKSSIQGSAEKDYLSVYLNSAALENFPYESPYLKDLQKVKIRLNRAHELDTEIFFRVSTK